MPTLPPKVFDMARNLADYRLDLEVRGPFDILTLLERLRTTRMELTWPWWEEQPKVPRELRAVH